MKEEVVGRSPAQPPRLKYLPSVTAAAVRHSHLKASSCYGPTALTQQLTTVPSYPGHGDPIRSHISCVPTSARTLPAVIERQFDSYTALERLKSSQKSDRKSHRNQRKTAREVGLTMR